MMTERAMPCRNTPAPCSSPRSSRTETSRAAVAWNASGGIAATITTAKSAARSAYSSGSRIRASENWNAALRTFASPIASVSRTPERTSRHRTMTSTTNAAPTTISVMPSARRSPSSENRPVICAPSQPPGRAPADAGREERPVDLPANGVAEKAEDAEEEADDEVRATTRTPSCPRPQERGHAQRAEDDADRSAEQTDHTAERGGGQEARTFARPRVERPREHV